MTPSPFAYVRPESLDEAFSALDPTLHPQALPLAGGQSLLPWLKQRRLRPQLLVDLARIPELRQLTLGEQRIRIGANLRHAEIASALTSAAPALAQAAQLIGDVQVRNRGTLGGSLAHSDPAADYPAALIALNAQVHLGSAHGQRRLDIEDFFLGPYRNQLQPGEIILAVELAPCPTSRYLKKPHPVSGFALCGVAQALHPDDPDGPRNGVTGVATRPFLLRHGSLPAGVEYHHDLHASSAYRAHLLRLLLEQHQQLHLHNERGQP